MATSQAMPAAPRRPRGRLHRPLSLLWLTCVAVGLFLVGSFAYGMWHGVSEQQHLNHEWQYQIAPRQLPSRGVDASLQRPVNGIDFAISVPKLGYFAAVKEGVDLGVLYSGPGHYPQTQWPGSAGTVAVAAHNVYWINFPQLAKGDEIDLQTRYGTYRYRVTGSAIVDPGDRGVILPDADGYHLTLTTCWPLWAGAFATRRYVIFADQVWPSPLAPGYG